MLVIQMGLNVMPQVCLLPELVGANTADKYFFFFADACDNTQVLFNFNVKLFFGWRQRPIAVNFSFQILVLGNKTFTGLLPIFH